METLTEEEADQVETTIFCAARTPCPFTFVAHVILTFLVFRNAETSDKKDWKELILLRRRVGRWVILFEEQLVDQQSHDPVYFPHHRGQDPGSGGALILTFIAQLTLAFLAHCRHRQALGKRRPERVHTNMGKNENCGGGCGDIQVEKQSRG